MICREGTNCWCTTKTDKAAFLIDGADYYEALILAARQARHSLYIAGWDIDSRLRLNRRNKVKGDIPPLGKFLNQIAKNNKSLQIYILVWDFPLMFLRERQWLPQIHLGWKTHRHIHFELDGEHPIGSSHHEKIVVVDDSIAIVGSANLNNRSMGLDTECCLVTEGEPESKTGAFITNFRRRLMAEHLGTSVEPLSKLEKENGSLLQTITAVDQSDRGLAPLEKPEPVVDGTEPVPDETYLDPGEPFMLDRMLDHFVREPQLAESGLRRYFKIAAILLALFGLAAVWRWTPLSQWLTIERMAQWAGLVDHTPVLILAVIGAYILGGLLFVPITLMVAATALILPPWQSFISAMTGAVLNAGVTYMIGSRLGKDR